MKKIFMLIACLAIAGGAVAQDRVPNEKQFVFGAKVGLNVTGMVGKGIPDNAKSKAGVSLGLVGEYRVNKLFAIAPEFLYSLQGMKEKDGNSKFITKSNYINVPILARFYVLERLSLEVGPQFGFATSITGKLKENDVKAVGKYESDTYNVFELALGFGATYNCNHKFFASARYNIGLTNVFKDEYADENGKSGNKNSVFQLSVGYYF